MALPDHYTGKDGEIKIDGNIATLVNFSLDISVGTIASARIGKVSDLTYPGKKSVSGTITQVLITGDLLAMMIGADADITTSALETLLDTFNLDAAAREETTITNDPTDPTTVKATLTVGDAVTTAGSIMIHGTDSNDAQVTETINFAAMAVGDGAQVVHGSQIFKTTDFVTIMAALESGAASYSAIKLEGVSGTKTLKPGTSELFTIIGKVVDANGKYFQMTATDCFFTAGTFPIGDAETIVQTDLPFVLQDPDEDLELVWTSA